MNRKRKPPKQFPAYADKSKNRNNLTRPAVVAKDRKIEAIGKPFVSGYRGNWRVEVPCQIAGKLILSEICRSQPWQFRDDAREWRDWILNEMLNGELLQIHIYGDQEPTIIDPKKFNLPSIGPKLAHPMQRHAVYDARV
jgi:hypothetical protein